MGWQRVCGDAVWWSDHDFEVRQQYFSYHQPCKGVRNAWRIDLCTWVWFEGSSPCQSPPWPAATLVQSILLDTRGKQVVKVGKGRPGGETGLESVTSPTFESSPSYELYCACLLTVPLPEQPLCRLQHPYTCAFFVLDHCIQLPHSWACSRYPGHHQSCPFDEAA